MSGEEPANEYELVVQKPEHKDEFLYRVTLPVDGKDVEYWQNPKTGKWDFREPKKPKKPETSLASTATFSDRVSVTTAEPAPTKKKKGGGN